MKKCSYCLEEKEGLTKEHVIPAGLLKMFPEQDVTFSNTINKSTFYKDNQGSSIKDVCQKCNNDLLGPLDTYGNNFIGEFFLKKYKDESITIPYDFHLLQRWLLKIVFNTLRSSGLPSDWFIDEIGYITHNIQEQIPPVSIFGGIHVDMTAFGEDKALLLSPLGPYKPLYVHYSPLILENGIAFSMRRKIPITKDAINIRRAEHVFTVRFGSAMFLIILWNKKIYSSAVDDFNIIFESKYPYKLFRADRSVITLARVTDSLNCFQPGIIQNKKAIFEADEGIREVLGGRSTFETQEEWNRNWSEEKQKEGRLLIDRQTFPDNKRIQKEYDEYFKE